MITASSTVHRDRDAVLVSSESPTDFCCFVIIDDGGFVTGEIVGEYPTGKSDMILRIAEHAWPRRRHGTLTYSLCEECDAPVEHHVTDPDGGRVWCSMACSEKTLGREAGWQKVTDPRAVAAEIREAAAERKN